MMRLQEAVEVLPQTSRCRNVGVVSALGWLKRDVAIPNRDLSRWDN